VLAILGKGSSKGLSAQFPMVEIILEGVVPLLLKHLKPEC
jgi:hypothetical protein